MDVSAATAARVLAWLLEQEQPTTRPAIANALGLSRPTVFAAMDRLESAQLVEAIGVDSGRPGRSASLYSVSRAAGLVGAVDIGGSNVRVAVADACGALLATRREATVKGDPDQVLAQVVALLREALSEVDGETGLSTISMSVPGVVDLDGRTVRFATNIDHSEPFDFATPVKRAFDCAVHLDNNVNLAAIGEQWRGAAKGTSDFAVVAVGAGVGAGVVLDGQVLRGAHRAAGEIAYLPAAGPLRPIDPVAHDEAGGIRLLAAARGDARWQNPPSTVQELFERAEAGEPVAVEYFEREVEQIVRIVASVCAVVDPEVVILTGGLGANERLIDAVRARLQTLALFPPTIIGSSLGERASIMGAVRTATSERKDELLRELMED